MHNTKYSNYMNNIKKSAIYGSIIGSCRVSYFIYRGYNSLNSLEKYKVKSPITAYKKLDCGYVAKLTIPVGAITNIERQSCINKKYAKHRASYAYVEHIINPVTGKYSNSIENASSTGKSLLYTSGNYIYPTNFSNDIDNICSDGIHFFLDKEIANNYEFNTDMRTDQNIISANENGVTFYGDNGEEFYNIKYDKVSGILLKYVPVDKQTNEMCMKSIEKDPWTLEYVKIPQTKEMIESAISRNGNILKYVKDPTEEQIIMAVKNNPFAIYYVNEITPSIYNEINEIIKNTDNIYIIEDIINLYY